MFDAGVKQAVSAERVGLGQHPDERLRESPLPGGGSERTRSVLD